MMNVEAEAGQLTVMIILETPDVFIEALLSSVKTR